MKFNMLRIFHTALGLLYACSLFGSKENMERFLGRKLSIIVLFLMLISAELLYVVSIIS